MIKYLLVCTLISNCLGCASYWDQKDPCQMRAELNRPAGYQRPEWCGASLGRQYIYSASGSRIGYINK